MPCSICNHPSHNTVDCWFAHDSFCNNCRGRNHNTEDCTIVEPFCAVCKEKNCGHITRFCFKLCRKPCCKEDKHPHAYKDCPKKKTVVPVGTVVIRTNDQAIANSKKTWDFPELPNVQHIAVTQGKPKPVEKHAPKPAEASVEKPAEAPVVPATTQEVMQAFMQAFMQATKPAVVPVATPAVVPVATSKPAVKPLSKTKKLISMLSKFFTGDSLMAYVQDVAQAEAVYDFLVSRFADVVFVSHSNQVLKEFSNEKARIILQELHIAPTVLVENACLLLLAKLVGELSS